MMKLKTYTSNGNKVASVDFPKTLQEKENIVLLAQAIRVYEAGRHPGLSKTKTRGEVQASTKKIYRQKGTGHARHGALSAPIFVGGGRAHGPKGVKRQLSLSKKMRRKALKIALSLKAKEGRLIVISGISALRKTKEAAFLINKITAKEKEISPKARFIFVLSKKNKQVRLALRNIVNVETRSWEDLNAYKVYLGGVLILDKEVLNELKDKKDRKPETEVGRARSSGGQRKSKHRKIESSLFVS